MADMLLTLYMREQLKNLKIVFPEVDEETLKEIIQKTTIELKKPKKLLIETKNERKKISVQTFDKLMAADQPILLKSGMLYKRHSQSYNILAEMLKYLDELRSKYKNDMFEHINDEDKTFSEMCNIFQRTIKIIMNSFYGATIQGQSIFYNPDFGPSITYQGECVIMTAISIFERIVSNNITFYTLSDVLNYCNNIISEEYVNDLDFEEGDVVYNSEPMSKEVLIKYLLKHFEDPTSLSVQSIETLDDYLSKLSYYDYCKIFYKNNLIPFIDLIHEDFEETIREDYFNPMKPPSPELKDKLEEIWSLINDWCMYNYNNYYSFYEAHYRKRKAVLTIDTDSNFVFIYNLCESIDKYYKCLDTDNKIISIVSVIVYFLTKVIAITFERLTANSNIEPEYRGLITMKNEVLNKRIFLTTKKKQYSYKLLSKEGNKLDNPKVEITGLAIRKVDCNKLVGNYFKDILKEDIFVDSTDIDLSKVISKVFKLEEMIEESIKSGSTDYSIPEKANQADAYVEPFNQQAYRGTVLWNTLFPDKEISLPNKVNSIKLKIPNDWNAMKKYLTDNHFEEYIESFKTIFDTEAMFKKDILTIICLPKNEKKIPKVIRDFIDIDKMVLDNINNAKNILEGMGINVPTVNYRSVPTNVISI